MELSAHGGRVVLKKILRLCCENGARLAEPGEFTKRAFLNGKMDLTEAEAVMDIIGAKARMPPRLPFLPATEPFSKELSAIKEEILFAFGVAFGLGRFPRGGHPRGGKRGPAFENFPCKGRLQKLVDTFDRGQIAKAASTR